MVKFTKMDCIHTTLAVTNNVINNNSEVFFPTLFCIV